MKLILTKDMGLAKAGDTHVARDEEQGKALIEAGFAKKHPKADEKPKLMKRELYEDKDGSFKTREVPVKPGEESQAIPTGSSVTTVGEISTSSSQVKTKADKSKTKADENSDEDKDGGDNKDTSTDEENKDKQEY